MTPKQLRFCQEYVIDLNGSQAAIRAGYSEKTANRIANQNLSKPDIQENIQKAQIERADRLEITSDEVINGLRAIAVHGTTDSARVRAYELLGKHLGMFTERLEVADKQTKPRVVFYWPDNGRDPRITARLKAKAEENRRNGIKGDATIEL